MNRDLGILLLLQGLGLLGAGSATGDPIWSVGTRLDADAYAGRRTG